MEMKNRFIPISLLLAAACMLAASPGGVGAPAGDAGTAAANPFAGRWDISIKTPKAELPSWIEVSDEQGKAKVVMVGVSEHATPLAKAEIKQGEIEFVSPKGEEGFENDTTFKGKLVGRQLVGTATGPGGVSWSWIGRRAPALKRKGAPKWGAPVNLFDGRDFTGWRFSDPKRAKTWTIENGTLVSNGHGSEIITTAAFNDFKLHIEFHCGPKANSGVYLRGRYEVQIETDSEAEPPSHHTGGVYGYLDPTPEQPRKAGVWQTLEITLVGRTVTVVQNGVTVIDQKEIPGITGGAIDSHEGLPGPIYIQGDHTGGMKYRNITISEPQNAAEVHKVVH